MHPRPKTAQRQREENGPKAREIENQIDYREDRQYQPYKTTGID